MDKTVLRRGWTTGACATAAAKAACIGLVSGTIPSHITIALPQGRAPTFSIHQGLVTNCCATASVIKDAGDDPDITHRAEIVVSLAPESAGKGLVFRAGAGVGVVTRPGLVLPVGEPAINPVPRAMITHNIAFARRILPPDLSVTVSIINGLKLARYTLNGRLGIVGGLSVLGTTGVVMPYSCSAWVTAIQRGVEVARAAGLTHIAGATGRMSEQGVQKLLDLPDISLISVGDFIGALLHYLRRNPIHRLTLAGGFAKLVKLARGHLNLHSGRCRVEPVFLADIARKNGASVSLTALLARSQSARQSLKMAKEEGVDLSTYVARRARNVAAAVVGSGVCVEVVLFDHDGTLLAVEQASY